ncbi:acyltransferase domain-containing protein [Streptomyces sp. NBC_01136]|uniref:type I polyketide synthase n=1 Tax=unclassified Streptomyces TaxID=2593676 RepID=UPI00324FB087|nr:acyltransferase domain-containing protein [Streptomyces sp. NBC_01136]
MRTAVVGMALRFPGADTPAGYWRDIRAGVTHVRRFSDAELAAAGFTPEEYGAPDFVAASAPLPGIDGFDAAFFGMSAREATVTDPQQRLLLECTHHALEDAGYAQPRAGVRIGVCASTGYRLYSLHSYLANNLAEEAGSGDWQRVKQTQVGTYPDFAAPRAAHRLGLTGPALNVATACSSSLVCIHLARQALHLGDADIMVVASAALHLPQVTGHRHVRGSTLSRSGAVRAFDADADGTVGGNGVAAVVLKPLERALADGDTVYAVIAGSAVTNDGADRTGFAAPGLAGQRDAVLGALRTAGVPADSIGYLEAHGTGTLKGDPIEFAALTEAFRLHTDRVGFCALGSTKPAIGHLDSAAGLAGLIKAVLVLRHGEIPPLVNHARPNPALDVAASPFALPLRALPWPAEEGRPRRAGVHSIGMGGTNAHVILEEAPAPAPRPPERSPAPTLLPLAGHTPEALVASARAFRHHLAEHPGTDPADLLLTTALGRRQPRHRLVVTAAPGDVVAALDAFVRGEPGAYARGVAEEEAGVEAVFLFTGQGSGYDGMGAALAERFPVVARTLAECAEIHRDETGEDGFLDRLLGAPTPTPTPTLSPAGIGAGAGAEAWDTAFAQPALFALQLAQTRLWRRFGVEPGAVAGHSAGEYAALCAAGALTPEDGLRLVCKRGRLMRDGTAAGGMLAVSAAEDVVRGLVADVDGLELAVVNGPGQYVVGGPPAAVATARARLAERGTPARPLPVDRAFHTALLDPVLEDFRDACGKVRLRPVRVEFVSGPDGVRHPVGWLPDADYLVRQTRRPVDFAAVLRTLDGTPQRTPERTSERAPDPSSRRSVFVEVGPDAPLTGLVRQARPDVTAVPTQRRADRGLDTLWAAVARLHCAGRPLDWAALLDGCHGRRIPLPPYPFQHRSHWTGPPPTLLPHDRGEDDRGDDDRSTEDGMTEQALLDRVLKIGARHLGYAPEEIAADQTFVGLGADSLQLIGMLRQLEAEFGVEIGMREILEEAGTPLLAARLIAARTASPDADDEPVHATPDEEPIYATRAEVEELARQIRQLAETQTRMLGQLTEAVALLTDHGNRKAAEGRQG